MDKNCVRGRGSWVSWRRTAKPERVKATCVHAARVRGKIPHLIRGDLPNTEAMKWEQESAEAVVVDGVTTIWGTGENQLQGEGPNGKGVE